MGQIRSGAIMALIPARAGSAGIKNKNIAEVGGFPLIAYSIAAAKLCGMAERIIVSTDSADYAGIARKYGAQVPFLRPERMSRGDSLDIEYIRHALEMLLELEGSMPEFILLLRPTTPLRDPQKLKDMAAMLPSNPDASSIVSVSETDECPYKWMRINGAGYLESPFAELKPDDVNLPRQSFPRMLVPDGYADIIRSRVVLGQGCVYGDRAVPYFPGGSVIDIDSEAELSALRESRFRESEVYHYLSDNFRR